MIPTFNSQLWLEACLQSVLVQASPSWSVVVVDNGSSDGTVTTVRTRWPSVKVIEMDRNVGYGAAVNLGARALPGGHVLALNVDTVLGPRALELLTSALERNPDVGVVAPRLCEPDGRLQPSAHDYPAVRALFAEAFFLDRLPGLGRRVDYHRRSHDYSRSQRVGWATGAALVFRDVAWQQSGGFDPRFFFFVEEIDLQRRLTQLGWTVMLETDAIVVHFGGKRPLPPERFLHAHEGFALYFGKEEGDLIAWLARVALCLSALTRAIGWTALMATSAKRRDEAIAWRTMFWKVFLGSASRLPAALPRRAGSRLVAGPASRARRGLRQVKRTRHGPPT